MVFIGLEHHLLSSLPNCLLVDGPGRTPYPFFDADEDAKVLLTVFELNCLVHSGPVSVLTCVAHHLPLIPTVLTSDIHIAIAHSPT